MKLIDFKYDVEQIDYERFSPFATPDIIANVKCTPRNYHGQAINMEELHVDIHNKLNGGVSAPTVKRVIFSDPATIIFWEDGSKTVVKCQEGDTYNPETGFALAYLKKLLGNDNTFNKEINKYVGPEKGKLTMPDPKDAAIRNAYGALSTVLFYSKGKATKAQLEKAIDQALLHLLTVVEDK